MSTAKEADARMRHLELVGLSEDGTSVVLNDVETGESFGVQLDDRLRAAVVHDRVRLGQLELALTSTLRPKDIQARIRAGQSSADVAAAAGVSVERIMRFASPVLAEREHVATQAQRSVLRRPGSDARARSPTSCRNGWTGGTCRRRVSTGTRGAATTVDGR